MDATLFTQLSLIIVVATIVAGIMRLLRQPLIIGYIIAGVLIGPAFLNLIGEHATFHSFSSFGIVLLLFIIGLGLNLTIIRRMGRVVFVTALAQMLFTTLIGGAATLAFGLSPTAALITGLALSFSSTIIIIKVLNDKREHGQLYGQITIGVLILQDIVASVALLFLATGQNGALSPDEILVLVAKGGALFAGLALAGWIVLPRLGSFVARSQEFLFLFALAWGFGIATLFELAGLSLEVGALFAGVTLAALPYSQEMAARLKPLRDFFVVIFFIALGEGLQFNNLAAALPLSLALSIVVLAVKPLITLMALGALAYTKRTSFKTAISLGQLSEFSLIFIVLAASRGLVPAELSSTLTLTTIITIAVSAYLMKYDDQLFKVLSRGLQLFERKVVKNERDRRQQLQAYDLLLFGYRKGGTEFIKTFHAIHKSFVVIDYDPEVIKTLEEQKLAYRYGDAADLELLEELGVERAKMVVSTITDFETNLSLVRHIGVVNPKAVIICHAEQQDHALDLYRLGATYVILPHYISSRKIGDLIKRHGISQEEFEPFRAAQIADLSSKHKHA